CSCSVVVFFNDTATTEIYTLSLHDALPISGGKEAVPEPGEGGGGAVEVGGRSEEHTSELQSHLNLVCRLLLEKKEDGSRARPRLLSPSCSPSAPASPTARAITVTSHDAVFILAGSPWVSTSFPSATLSA